jgi:hypothetical protein
MAAYGGRLPALAADIPSLSNAPCRVEHQSELASSGVATEAARE